MTQTFFPIYSDIFIRWYVVETWKELAMLLCNV